MVIDDIQPHIQNDLHHNLDTRNQGKKDCYSPLTLSFQSIFYI